MCQLSYKDSQERGIKMTKQKKRKLRILWSSNAPWSMSGYGVFTRDITTRLRDDGWPLAIVGFWGLQGNPTVVDGIKIYPGMGDPYGSDSLYQSALDFKADVVFTMQDIFTLNPKYLDLLGKAKKPWIPYLPIDQSPPPAPVLERLRFAHKIVTFAEYGQNVLEEHGFASKLIKEGIDTDIFKPSNQAKARAELKIPQDVFLFTMIAANKENPPRKGFQEVLEAFKMFYEKHPEAAILFHTQQVSPASFPIQEYAKYLGISNRLFFMDQYKSTYFSDSEQIAKEMNACDVYLQPSMTEGFGLTAVEAMSCGKPVIVNNCTSMPENVIPGKTGEICDTAEYKWWRSMGGYVYPANPVSMYEKMEILYDKVKKDKNKLKTDCRNHVLTNFDINNIFKHKWVPFLEELQEELIKPAK